VNCAGVRDALPAFALGVAPVPDASSVELHVETCAACRREAIDLQRAVAAFGYALAPVEPAGPELEERVVAAVHAAAGNGSRRRSRRHRRAGVTLLAAAIEATMVFVFMAIRVALARAKVDAATVVPFTAVAEMVTAKLAGAACTELAATAPAMTVADNVTPRLVKIFRSFSSARVTRILAASSLAPSAEPTPRR